MSQTNNELKTNFDMCVRRLCRCRVDVGIHVHQGQRYAIKSDFDHSDLQYEAGVGLPVIIIGKFTWLNLDGEIVQHIRIALVAISL